MLATQLKYQQRILSQILLCRQILQIGPPSNEVSECLERLIRLLDLTQQDQVFSEFKDLGLNEILATKPIDFELPSAPDEQLLVGMLFAESSSGPAASDDEKRCIAECVVNMAFYATYAVQNKTCYNSSFGDGKILSAIKLGSLAYGGAQWNRVMNGNILWSKAELEKRLVPSEVDKLKMCVSAVQGTINLVTPVKDSGSNRVLIQFNGAENAPPSPRQEKAARYSGHSFYAFKSGRECQ